MYVARHSEDYNCAVCTSQNKKYVGCTSQGNGPGIAFEDVVFRRCLLKLRQPVIRDWLVIYDHYKSGFLYTSGGLEQQPCKYLDVMRLIGHYYNTEETT